MIVSEGLEVISTMKKGGGEIPLPLVKAGSNLEKGNKASPSLGILQKDIKKGVVEKSPRLGVRT